MLTRAPSSPITREPGARCITLRPGIFETGMQQFMRSRDPAEFPSVALFRGFKEQGMLKEPADVARAIVAKLVLGPVENGRTYSHTELDGVAQPARAKLSASRAASAGLSARASAPAPHEFSRAEP